MELKRETAAAVEDAADSGTVITSTTSSLPLTEITSALERPERMIGLHFFNPVHLMDLVEVVRTRRNERRVERAMNPVVGRGGRHNCL